VSKPELGQNENSHQKLVDILLKQQPKLIQIKRSQLLYKKTYSKKGNRKASF
jgi:hypothetical protein